MSATTLLLSDRLCAIKRTAAALLLTAACAAAAHARDDKSQLFSQFVIDNLADYKQAVQYARQKQAPEVPMPPEIDSQCKLCGSDAPTQGEQAAKDWEAQVLEPEATYVKKLLNIQKTYELLGGETTIPREAAAALKQYNFSRIPDDVNRLVDRVYDGKAVPMAKKYKGEPKRAYAGIKFLLDVARQKELLSGNTTIDSEAVGLARDWVQSIADRIEQDILEGKKYNLCPMYTSIFRQILLMGGKDIDMSHYQQTVDKIQKMMYFDVNLDMHVHVIPKDGNGGGDETWSGKAKLHLKIDFQNACYTPEYVDGGTMTMTVTDLSLHDDEGNRVTLASSPNYIVPLGQPKLNLCDANPTLDTGIGSAGIPDEKVIYKGKMAPSVLLAAYLNIASLKNSLDLGLSLAAGAPAAPGAAQHGSAFANAAQQIAQIQQQIMSHSGDPNWISSPDGQAAMAAMQSAAAGARQDASALNQEAAAHKPVSLGTLQVPWTNGLAQPVSRNVEATGDDGNLRLKITVQNAPQ
jgi:hypothetical protein